MQPRRWRHQRLITLNLSNVGDYFASWVLKVCISVKKKKKRKIVVLCSHSQWNVKLRSFTSLSYPWQQRNVQNYVMHVQSCCLLIRLRHTYPFLFGNGYFFLRLSLPSILIDPVKTVTENARSQKRSPESRFLKTSAFLLRVDGRKRFRIRNTMMSYIIYF